MNLDITKNYFHKINIECDGPLGKVVFVENNIPSISVDQFTEKVLERFSEKYKVENCITKKIEQSYFEVEKQRFFDFKPSPYASSLKDALHKRTNRSVRTYSPAWSAIGMLGMTFCGGTLAYQSVQTVIQLQKRNFKQALTHGAIAVISGITIIIFGKLL